MPGSYYDRLGDLLSEVLESGELPKPQPSPEPGPAPREKTEAEAASPAKDSRESASAFFTGQPVPPRKGRHLTPPEARAFKTLSIPETADYAEARSLYRKKLQRFHPDKQGENALLQKVAREKTAQFIEAWSIVEGYFSR